MARTEAALLLMRNRSNARVVWAEKPGNGCAQHAAENDLLLDVIAHREAQS
jgi:hypothetical protein